MDDRAKLYGEKKKDLLAFKDDVSKALSKKELVPLFVRFKQYNQDKIITSDPYFMYLIDLCQGMMEGKLSILDAEKKLPEHYEGELNTKRIKTYKRLAQDYNVDEGTVRDIFCKGADWYKEQIV